MPKQSLMRVSLSSSLLFTLVALVGVAIVPARAAPATPSQAATASQAATLSQAATASPTQRSVSEKARLVRALSRERTRLRRDLQRYRLQLDATRVQMSQMNLDLSRARSRYGLMFDGVSRSLATMYKLRDTIDWATLVDHFGVGDPSSAAEYDFFSRVARQQQEALAQLEAQERQIALLQEGVSDLKELRLQQETDLRTRLETVDAALKSGEADLERARRALAAVRPPAAASQPTGSVPIPPPGVGGLFVGANHPPASYRPSGVKLAGLASWYGPGFQGNHTANGEIYNMYAFTCASRTLPFNTWLRLTYQGRAVFVRVNDRGPMAPERILDLSYASAQALGFLTAGVVYVRAEIWAR